MEFAVIGGTGLIGSQVVADLNASGYQAVPSSHSSGVDVVTGQGVQDAVADADVVIDSTNSPTFDSTSIPFFQTSMDNLLAAGEKRRPPSPTDARSSRTRQPAFSPL